MTTREPGQRAGLTRDAVLDAARELLSHGGLAAITMRALARRLEVAPNALYSHVAGKTELVDALLDDALAAVVHPSPTTKDPVRGLSCMMTSTYEVLLAAPDLVPLYLARQGARGPNAVALGHTMDVLLARAGVRQDDVPAARRALIVHAIGSAAFTTGPEDRPLPPSTARATFTAGLHWLLSGIATDH